ncbi:MAG: TOPRIM nucleotidyl transferase/hydrolase domain-containing protein [Anaerolineales bacterium]
MQSLSADGTQIIYTTHSQEFLDLESLDILRLVKKPMNNGTKVTEPSSNLLVDDWRERARIAKKFGPPRTEILFAKRVVLVEGETERAAIAILTELYPSELSLDMRNCSVIECGGKQAIPHYASICQSVGKPVMVVFDTDSHLTDENKINVNRSRNEAIYNSMPEKGDLYSFAPYIEEEVGVEGDGKTAKDTKMREFLLSLDSWESVPNPLRQLVQEIDNFTSADA